MANFDCIPVQRPAFRPIGQRVLSCLVAVLLLAAQPITARSETAIEVVEAFHVDLLDVMKTADSTSYEERRATLEPAITRLFNSRFMASVAASSHWRKLDEADQATLTEAFRNLTLANYAARFNGYAGQEFETTGEQDAGPRAKYIHTRLVKSSGEAIKISYLLRQTGEDWRIIDVVVKSGISELAMRRSEFAPILRDQGFSGLIAMINSKISDLASGEES